MQCKNVTLNTRKHILLEYIVANLSFYLLWPLFGLELSLILYVKVPVGGRLSTDAMTNFDLSS